MHNFICTNLLKKLSFLVTELWLYSIVLGDGPSVVGEGVFKDITVQLLEIQVVQHFLPLAMATTAIIWKYNISKLHSWIQTNYIRLVMKSMEGKEVPSVRDIFQSCLKRVNKTVIVLDGVTSYQCDAMRARVYEWRKLTKGPNPPRKLQIL